LNTEAAARAERQIETFITRRDTERRKSEGERRTEEMWAESERVYFAKLQEDNRIAWCEYHRRLSALHQGLADEHDAELKKLLENGNGHHEKGD
jgi:hypothetical protein